MNILMNTLAIAIMLLFASAVVTAILMTKCDECHKHYIIFRSTSKYKPLFCTVQCEFVNMALHISNSCNLPMEKAKAELKTIVPNYKDCQ